MLKVALVGAGRMGRVHLEALSLSAGCDPVAVVEPDRARREELVGEVPGLFSDVDEMVGAGVAEAALVAAPSPFHNSLVSSLASAGLPVLCEKPGGATVEEIRSSEEAAREAGVVLQFGYWRRFVPELRRLRERFLSGAAGRLALVACHQWDEAVPSEEFRAHAGGIGPDMAVHELDQVRWLTGRGIEGLTAVRAGGDERSDPADPDGAAVLVRLEGGAAAVITLGRRFPEPDACWAELWADEGYGRAEFMRGPESAQAFLAGMIAQADAFADAVGGAPQEGADAADAEEALAWALEVGRSLAARSGRWTAR